MRNREIAILLLGAALVSGPVSFGQVDSSPTPREKIRVGEDTFVVEPESSPSATPDTMDADLGLQGAEIDMRKVPPEPEPGLAKPGELEDLFRFEEINLDLRQGVLEGLPKGAAEESEKEREERREIPDTLPSQAEVQNRARGIETELSQRQISLLDALRITLLQDPQIQLQRQDAEAARAAVRIARGQFDMRLVSAAGYSRDRRDLTENEVSQQVAARNRNKALIKAVDQETGQLEEDIAILKAGGTPKAETEQQELELALQEAIQDILGNLVTPEQFQRIENIRAQQRQLDIKTREDILNTLKGTSRNAQNQLEKFPVNSVRNAELVNFEVAMVKEFRNGISISPFLAYTRTTDNFSYRGNIPPFNDSEVGVQIDIPLARGAGSSAAAFETAAMIDYEASMLALRHVTSQRLLTTALAYWNLVAAQERLALFVRSELIASSLSTLGQALVDADAMPAADMSQIEAQVAQTMANRIAAEIALVEAAQTLGTAMGLRAEEIVAAPIALDSFPNPISHALLSRTDRQVYIQEALRRRADRQAAIKLEQSGKVLVDAARFDLRPQIDALVRVGYTGHVEDASGDAFYSTYTRGQAGPSVFVGVSMDWPFANNRASGEYETANALYKKRVLETGDLSRTIVSNVYLNLKRVELSLNRITSAQKSVASIGNALETEREKFKLGDATVVDSITTEDRLTSSLLSLVDARLSYVQALALLRFETGTLLPGQDGRADVKVRELITLPDFQLSSGAANK